jgi:hypothetical protein
VLKTARRFLAGPQGGESASPAGPAAGARFPSRLDERPGVERLVFPRQLSQTTPMTKDAIQSTLHAQPFKPFLLRLTDGTLVPVPHPDFMVVSQGGRTAIVNTEGEKFSIVDLGLVTTIELGSDPSS